MRFSSQARADLATRILFFSGIATAIAGLVTIREHRLLGIALLVVGLPLGAFGPAWVTGPAAAGDPPAERDPGERTRRR